MCVKGAAHANVAPAVFDGTKEESNSKRQHKAAAVFLMGFMMIVYVFTAVTQVFVNDLTFDKLNHNRNNKTTLCPFLLPLCF